MTMSKLILLAKNINWLLLVIYYIGIFLGFHTITSHEFWCDEIFAAETLEYKWPLSYTKLFEKHPSFYFYLLGKWSRILGINELSLRSFSALLNIHSIIFIYKIALLIFNKNTAYYAAFFLTLSPFHLWY